MSDNERRCDEAVLLPYQYEVRWQLRGVDQLMSGQMMARSAPEVLRECLRRLALRGAVVRTLGGWARAESRLALLPAATSGMGGGR